MAAGAKSNQAPIVIKKVKKVVGGGHHGGAWKVAYADFVTAMMAFFLLMWLINTTTPEQKRGIADYFAPASVSQTTSGSGGMLAGKALSEEGVRADKGSPVVDSAGQGVGSSDSPDSSNQQSGKDDSAEKAKQAAQNAEFEKAEMSIRQAMQDMPEIAELSKQVIMEITPEGLRIQIIDQEGRSMFPPGDARPYERTQRLLAAISGIIAELPNRLSISGHTDGSPPNRAGQSNWELSADRANASRRVLQATGIPNDRISSVSGKADSEPLFPDDPTLPGNRRVSITLLREAPVLPGPLALALKHLTLREAVRPSIGAKAGRGDSVTRQFLSKQLRFYLTTPSPCPYLPDREERKVFTNLDGGEALGLNETLTHAGFRRSQNIAYRPACDGCDSCISARIPTRSFEMSRSWRKVMARNDDLHRVRRPAEATEEQFWLLRRYLNHRHAEGGMADMTLLDYAAMVEETAVHTHMVEYRYTKGPERDELAGAAIVDLLRDGLSLVYSFFDPRDERRSLGAYIILDHVRQAQAAGLEYVYLGYWVPGSDKMGYKVRFRPLEILRAGAWTPFDPAAFGLD